MQVIHSSMKKRFTNLKFSRCKIADCQFVEDIPCAIDTVDDGSGDDDEERKKKRIRSVNLL